MNAIRAIWAKALCWLFLAMTLVMGTGCQTRRTIESHSRVVHQEPLPAADEEFQ